MTGVPAESLPDTSLARYRYIHLLSGVLDKTLVDQVTKRLVTVFASVDRFLSQTNPL
jgi:hypothetical protein